MDDPNSSVTVTPLVLDPHKPVLGHLKVTATRLLSPTLQTFSFSGHKQGRCPVSYSPSFAALEYPMIE
jgi:hypothetical protein